MLVLLDMYLIYIFCHQKGKVQFQFQHYLCYHNASLLQEKGIMSIDRYFKQLFLTLNVCGWFIGNNHNVVHKDGISCSFVPVDEHVVHHGLCDTSTFNFQECLQVNAYEVPAEINVRRLLTCNDRSVLISQILFST